MDDTWNSRHRHSDHQDSDDHDEMSLVPVPEEEPHAPPVDIDERGGAERSTESIALPEHEGSPADDPGDSIDDQIDELLPRPQDEPYHDDDAAEPDPYDVSGEVDELMPRPTGDARDEIDDFSTGEELDIESAPLGRSGGDRIGEMDETGDGSPGDDTFPADHEPVNHESGFFSSGYTPPNDSRETAEPELTPDTPAEQLLLPDGTTSCPVCGRQTEALRFCSYCGSKLTGKRRELTATSMTGRLQERGEMLLEPLAQWTRPGTVRFLLATGALLVLFSLLANNGALALIFGAAILPLILLYWCTELDVFEKEPPILVAAFALVGTVIGAVTGWVSSLVVTSSWFEGGVLNYGAAGFGGRFAETAGNAPFIVWLVSGILLPVGALAAIIGGPIAMRQTLSLRNEIMDGLTIAAAMGAGFSLGTAIVFASPMLANGGPVSDASGWTLTVIGVTIIRPAIWTLSGAMLGAAAWMYLRSGRLSGALIPAIAGIAAPLLFTLVSLQLQSNGLWAEILWGILVSILVAFFYRRTLSTAMVQDREVLGNDQSRIVCPNCARITPSGAYCSNCGADVSSAQTTGPRAGASETPEAMVNDRDRDEIVATPVDNETIRL